MAISPKQYATVVGTLGIASFVCGIWAERKKPTSGEAIMGRGVIICKYPNDPSIFLGYVSTAFLALATVVGCHSVFYPYKGKSIPRAVIFCSKWCTSLLYIAVGMSIFAATFLIWPTVQGQIHHTHNVHQDLQSDCPTSKTGLLGGGAFASLNASLFWMITLMISMNVREDYFEDAIRHEVI